MQACQSYDLRGTDHRPSTRKMVNQTPDVRVHQTRKSVVAPRSPFTPSAKPSILAPTKKANLARVASRRATSVRRVHFVKCKLSSGVTTQTGATPGGAALNTRLLGYIHSTPLLVASATSFVSLHQSLRIEVRQEEPAFIRPASISGHYLHLDADAVITPQTLHPASRSVPEAPAKPNRLFSPPAPAFSPRIEVRRVRLELGVIMRAGCHAERGGILSSGRSLALHVSDVAPATLSFTHDRGVASCVRAVPVALNARVGAGRRRGDWRGANGGSRLVLVLKSSYSDSATRKQWCYTHAERTLSLA